MPATYRYFKSGTTFPNQGHFRLLYGSAQISIEKSLLEKGALNIQNAHGKCCMPYDDPLLTMEGREVSRSTLNVRTHMALL